MAIVRSYKTGNQVPPLTKNMAQKAIDLREKSGGATGPSQFTDAEMARDRLGTHSTVASGRMSLTFATELRRRNFGVAYNRGGMADLRFLRPVRPRDAITFTGKVTDITKVADGGHVSVEINGTNQMGDVTAVGRGACIVQDLGSRAPSSSSRRCGAL